MGYPLTEMCIATYCVICSVGNMLEKSHRSSLKSWGSSLNFVGLILGLIGYFYVFPKEDRSLLLLFVFVPFIISSNLALYLKFLIGRTNWYRSIWTNEKLDEKDKLGTFCFDFEKISMNIPVKRGDFSTWPGVKDDKELFSDSFDFELIPSLEMSDIKRSEILNSKIELDQDVKKENTPEIRVKARLYRFEKIELQDGENLTKAIIQFLFINYFLPEPVETSSIDKNKHDVEMHPWECLIPTCCASYSSNHTGSMHHNFHSLHICSNNILLALEFSDETAGAVSKTRNELEKYVETFIESVAVVEKNGESGNLSIDLSDIANFTSSLKFNDCFPSKGEFNLFLKEHAKDPVEWHVFERSPGFSNWLTQQYEKHCEIYKSRRENYIQETLEKWRIAG